MSFTQKKIHPIGFVEQGKDLLLDTIKKSLLGITILSVLWWVIYVSGFLKGTTQAISQVGNNFITNTTNTISSNFGTEMIKDEYGNINVLLVWYGGKNHDGGYLADSIIVASYDPVLHSASLISLPRDMIVNASWYINKINAVLAYKQIKTKDLAISAEFLSSKVSEITSLKIPYYALIDFDWFAELIDTMGGIEINVPKRIYDTTYPWPNWSYTTFSLNSWLQKLDWATALKYARSRHSTSDFSRSQRQQQIIQSMMSTVTKGWVLSLGMVKDFYDTYKKMVTTNIQWDEMIGLLKYGKTLPQLYSFWYTMECGNDTRKTMKPACLLYPVDSSLFNGMAWLLPIGASPGKISFYGYTQYFADFVAHNQWYLKEKLPISIYNATDKLYAKKFPYRDWVSRKLASKLKRYGFIVDNVDNASYASTGTTAVIIGDAKYEETLRMLKLYVNIDNVETLPASVWASGQILPSTINLYLGNSYLDQVWNKPFNYYK